MRYVAGVGIPLLLQALVTFIVIAAGSGGGSFVGLGAMLLALIGIPVTAIVNGIQIRSRPDRSGFAHVARSVSIGLVLPAVQVALAIVVSVFRL